MPKLIAGRSLPEFTGGRHLDKIITFQKCGKRGRFSLRDRDHSDVQIIDRIHR